MLPLWEGYDEWAHFAVVRQMAAGGKLLVPRDAPVSRDIEASFALVPMPWEMRSLPPPTYTEDQYWQLPREERERREAAFRAMPAAWGRENSTGPFTAYEALQPPLYYWIMAPALSIGRSLGLRLAGEVLLLRILSSVVASLIVPLVFLLAREVWGDRRPALGCAAIVAVMPGLALDVARVGNDCLAVVLFTLLTWLAVRSAQTGLNLRQALGRGCVLGLGLIAKAYFLTAIPAMTLIWAYGARKTRRAGPAVASALLSAGVAGWWYVHNFRTTGTLSGLSESVMLRGQAPAALMRKALGIDWIKAVDAILFSHLYFGGWSSLTVRSWMYHLFYIAIVVAAFGLARFIGRPAILALLAVYLSFWLGQLYNVLLLYLSKGLGGSMGWYLYAVVGAEVTLCVAGLRASRGAIAAGAIMFALLDLYTVHGVAIPYYTGMIRHRANGTLEALHWANVRSVGIGEAVERLVALKGMPVAVLVALWVVYLGGTVAAVACACARKCDSAEKR